MLCSVTCFLFFLFFPMNLPCYFLNDVELKNESPCFGRNKCRSEFKNKGFYETSVTSLHVYQNNFLVIWSGKAIYGVSGRNIYYTKAKGNTRIAVLNLEILMFVHSSLASNNC